MQSTGIARLQNGNFLQQATACEYFIYLTEENKKKNEKNAEEAMGVSQSISAREQVSKHTVKARWFCKTPQFRKNELLAH